MSAVVLAVSLVIDWDGAVNVMSQLHTSPGAATLLIGLCVLVTPNATLFSGSYLLGPGFAVGTHTIVTPTAVVLGPLPMFPLLAALPGRRARRRAGPSRCSPCPRCVAAFAVYRTLGRYPTPRWDEAALRGVGAGLICAVAFAVLAAARRRSRRARAGWPTWGPSCSRSCCTASPTFGIGGLLGSLAATVRHRRHV